MSDQEGSEILHIFERELRQSTEQMQSIFLDLEQFENFATAAPTIQEAYRLAHSLKGASRVIGLYPIEEISHSLEDQLQRLLRNEKIPASDEVSIFLHVCSVYIEAFEAFLKGEIFDSAPVLKQLTSMKDSELPQARELAVPAAQKMVAEAPQTGKMREEQLLISSHRIDELFRRMEEAFLIESRMSALLTDTDQSIQEKPIHEIRDLWSRQFGQLKNETGRLHFVLMQFHDMIRLFRMVPVKRLKVAIQKAIRDLSLTLNKPVSLIFRGEHQMLDASVLESLVEPVMHLVRNAVDHGIEAPQERKKQGKTVEGSITVDATVTGGFLNLILSDDGRGLNVDAIRKRALELQMVPADRLEHLQESDWFEFLFRPGFSTADSLSAISGRGMGMDIVRRRIQDLGGTLQISSRAKIGTTFAIQVPIGLLTPRVLLVRCGDHRAAFPITDVERVFRYDPSQVRKVNGTSFFEWNRFPIQLESLSDHLGWESAGPRSHVVLLNRQGIRKGMLVDEILSEIEQVAFPPPWNLRGVPYLSGVIVMGNGTLVPMIETRDLMKKVELSTSAPLEESVIETRQRNLLVVDDSPTIVALHRSILKNAGYNVLVAENGLLAWDIMQSKSIDLLLTDMEMPKMNGIDLIRKVRNDAIRKNVPIIVISQYGARDDLQKAADAGADRYIVKSGFNPQKLLEVIQELLME